jgi:subtilisin family serine protease
MLAIAALTVLLEGCQPPAESQDLSDEIFVKDPVEAHIAELPVVGADGVERTCDLPDDQILLMFAADVTPADAAGTLDRMQADLAGFGLQVVGQIPDLGIYQLEITNNETDPEAAIARLDAVISSLAGYAGVVTAGYNELLTARAIENDDDNCDITQYDRCPFAVIDYYQAIPVFDRVMTHVNLSDVTVAVIDSGLWVESGQFDDILPRTQFPGLSAGNTSYDYHLHKHGTNIAALIAADNGDGFVNGVALRVLGEHLHLIIGDAHIWGEYYSLARTLARARQSVLLGADIVNLSLGRDIRGGSPQWLANAQAEFDRLFNESPQTLFIAAAANDNYVLNGNDAPAGMPNANLLTVGGHESCHPNQRYAQSCTGPGVELAAPATNLPGLVGDNMVGPAAYTLDGNSFAAPLVASIAAIVKAIDPDMTGAELKTFLLDEENTWPAAAEVGGRRLALLKTVGGALLTRASASAALDEILDAFGPADDITDPSGYTANRLCGEINFNVAGSYTETATIDAPQITWGPDQVNYGLIGMGHQAILKVSNGGAAVGISTTAGFRLDEPYTGSIQIIVPSPEGELVTGVDGSSGTFSFCDCELTTRSLPLDWFSPDNSGPHQLIFIEASGSFAGTNQGALRLSDGEHFEGVTYATAGEFTTAFTLIDPEADTMEYLERHCTGGYLLGTPEP